MSLWTLIARGLTHHVRMQAALLAAVAAAAAVLTGALVVGDSVRGSLRDLAVERLGAIDQALVLDRFFRDKLATELMADEAVAADFAAAVPAIYLQATFSNPKSGDRANSAGVIGCDERFQVAGSDAPALPIAGGEVVLNEPLARELGAAVGDDVVLRLPVAASIPPDSPWGRKTETIRSRRLKVRSIIPARGLGEFALRPTQRETLVAYVSLKTLQSALQQQDTVNAIFLVGKNASQPAPPEADQRIAKALRPTLRDYGLLVGASKTGNVHLTTDRMLLSPVIEGAVLDDWKRDEAHPVLAYLANTIAVEDREIPYSVVAAVDFAEHAPWGPLVDLEGNPIGPLEADEIVLNQWAADDLGEVEPGDTVQLTYFEPESTHGEVREKISSFRLKAVCRIVGVADDPTLTPEVKGVTDRESIASWDPPFPFEADRIRDADEKYWKDHRGTPKGFVSLAAGRRLWSSRFGQATSIVLPQAGEGSDEPAVKEAAARLHFDPAALGFVFQPVKRQSLLASTGTTPFEYLFLGFSFFLIAAAALLVALVFRLGVERRAEEVGMLLAVGVRPGQVRSVLGVEAIIVSLLGGLVGAGVGVGYAWLMLVGLRTWWLAAVNTTRLTLHVDPRSLAIGAASGAILSLIAVAWALWSSRGVSVRRLLAGQMSEERFAAAGAHTAWTALASVVLLAGLGLAMFSRTLAAEQQALAFFGSGALVLIALVGFAWLWLAGGATGAMIASGGAAMARLSARNAARHAGRSALTVGLVAAASFLIVALSAFRIEPGAAAPRRDDGTGDFALIAESDQALLTDLNDPEVRIDLGLDAKDEELLAKSHIYALRVRAGDDASCLNLYQPRQPRILGAGDDLIDRGGFDWAQIAADASEEERADPWKLLRRPLPPDAEGRARVPVVIDLNTAMYSLHLYGGVGSTYEIDDGHGGKITLQVVGLLAGSTLQGDLVIAESQFRRLFPGQSGYKFFLIETPDGQADQVRQALEAALADYGFDAQPSQDRLAALAAVQNTYLSTFQSLGGLGLLLGTIGLAAVQLRNVLERRGELALLRAVGFSGERVAELVVIENVWLLLGGLAIGVAAALVAVVPQWLAARAAVPWLSLAATLAIVLIAGLLASLAALRAALSNHLVTALRGE